MPATAPARNIAAVRRFNRFYTRQIGLLTDHLLHSPFSLTEARVLYEIAQRDGISAIELSRALSIDRGYLSRMLAGFEHRKLLTRQPFPEDRRRELLSLTTAGTAAFERINAASSREIAALLKPLTQDRRRELTGAMQAIEAVLEPSSLADLPVTIRQHRSGDMGWVVERHGVLYCEEYGWDEAFEGLVAEIVAGFLQHHDPARERCWIAERGSERVGCVFCVRESERVARLRCLLVEPSARGAGVGGRLVNECLRFARRAGYRKMVLWTNDVLTAARRIYQRAGFTLASEEAHHSFGHDLVSQTWERDL